MSLLAKTLSIAAAALLLLPGSAAARSLLIDEGGHVNVLLDGKLRRELDRAGIEVEPLKPAHPLEKTIELPVKGEGGFEPGRGAGYAFLRGGIRLRAGKRSVTIRRMVLNTAKERLSGKVAGRSMALAATDRVRAYRWDIGILLKVDSLALDPKAAAALGAKLGHPEIFKPRRPLGRMVLGAPLFLAPAAEGAIHFSFDQEFRQKLESLGVSISPYGSAQSSPPNAFSFTQVRGEIDPEFEHGRLIGGKEEGIKFVQESPAGPREVTWRSITIGFENGFGGEGSDVVTASWTSPSGNSGFPIAQIEFGDTPSYNGKSSWFTGPPAVATLSPYAVQPLNDAFGGGKAVFAPGEPLGGFSFDAYVGLGRG